MNDIRDILKAVLSMIIFEIIKKTVELLTDDKDK